MAGLHPDFLRAVLPTVTVSYAEDWKDFADMHVPYVFDRLIVADSGAANRGREQWTVGWTPPPRKGSVSIGNGGELRKRTDQEGSERQDILKRQEDTEDSQVGKPMWAAPFVGLPAQDNWWTPVRAALLSYLKLPADPVEEPEAIPTKKPSFWDGKKTVKVAPRPVLTYISMQDEPVNAGSRLRREDHSALLQGLSALLKDGHLSEVHVVRGNGSAEVWEDRMRAIARSSVSCSLVAQFIDVLHRLLTDCDWSIWTTVGRRSAHACPTAHGATSTYRRKHRRIDSKTATSTATYGILPSRCFPSRPRVRCALDRYALYSVVDRPVRPHSFVPIQSLFQSSKLMILSAFEGCSPATPYHL